GDSRSLRSFPTRRSSDLGEDELERLARLLRKLLEVGLVLAREDDALQPGALRGERLLAHAADRQHLAGERDLARHPDVRGDRLADRKSTRLNSSHRTISY